MSDSVSLEIVKVPLTGTSASSAFNPPEIDTVANSLSTISVTVVLSAMSKSTVISSSIAETLVATNVTGSSSSRIASSTTLRGIEIEVAPAGIVTEVGIGVA